MVLSLIVPPAGMMMTVTATASAKATMVATITSAVWMVRMAPAPMLLAMGTVAADPAMSLGDPLRGRAFRSNRPAGDFHCNPCRLRELALAPR